MGLLNKLLKKHRFDYCKPCKKIMEEDKKQLFFIPVFQGNKLPENDVNYFLKNLIPVNNKSEIPLGYYACGGKKLVCDNCLKSVVSLEVFLPVRDQELFECYYSFDDGALNHLF